MTLKDRTNYALDFTKRLQKAIDLQDLELCQGILELRQEAMAGFEAAHRAADPREKETCKKEIRALQAADQALLTASVTHLEAIAKDFRENQVASGNTQAQQLYASTSGQGCIDRKA